MGLVVNDTDKSCTMIIKKKKRKNIVFLSLRNLQTIGGEEHDINVNFFKYQKHIYTQEKTE